MATQSSVLAWRIPGTGENGGLASLGLHRVGHDWSDLAAAAQAGALGVTGPFPSPGDLPNSGSKPKSPALQAISLPCEPPGKPLTHNSSLYPATSICWSLEGNFTCRSMTVSSLTPILIPYQVCIPLSRKDKGKHTLALQTKKDYLMVLIYILLYLTNTRQNRMKEATETWHIGHSWEEYAEVFQMNMMLWKKLRNTSRCTSFSKNWKTK